MKSYLDGSVVNEEAVQSVERLARTVKLGKSDGGNTTADTSRAVRDFHSLDGTNRGLEVLLWCECRSVIKIPLNVCARRRSIRFGSRVSWYETSSKVSISVNEHAVSVSVPNTAGADLRTGRKIAIPVRKTLRQRGRTSAGLSLRLHVLQDSARAINHPIHPVNHQIARPAPAQFGNLKPSSPQSDG